MIRSRRMRLAEHVAKVGEKKNAYMILVRKPVSKILPGRSRRRWANNIKLYPREIGWDGMA
jgi:hypothetical protein